MSVTGWLEKLNLQHTGWNRVWAEYYGGRLIFYYDDEAGARAGQIRGAVNLKDAVLRVGYTNVTNAAVIRTAFTLRAVADLKTPYVFMVETSKRQFKFCCDTEENMLRWGSALAAIMNRGSLTVKSKRASGSDGDRRSGSAARDRRGGASGAGGEVDSREAQVRTAHQAVVRAAQGADFARERLASLPHPALPGSTLVVIKKAKGLHHMNVESGHDVTVTASVSAPKNEMLACARAGWAPCDSAEEIAKKRQRVATGIFGGMFVGRKMGVDDAEGTGTVTSGTTIAAKASADHGDLLKDVRAVWDTEGGEAGSRVLALRLRPPPDTQGELCVLRSAATQTGAGSSMASRMARARAQAQERSSRSIGRRGAGRTADLAPAGRGSRQSSTDSAGREAAAGTRPALESLMAVAEGDEEDEEEDRDGGAARGQGAGGAASESKEATVGAAVAPAARSPPELTGKARLAPSAAELDHLFDQPDGGSAAAAAGAAGQAVTRRPPRASASAAAAAPDGAASPLDGSMNGLLSPGASSVASRLRSSGGLSRMLAPACFLVGHRLTITVKGNSPRCNASLTVEMSELPIRPNEALELDVFLRPGAADAPADRARAAMDQEQEEAGGVGGTPGSLPSYSVRDPTSRIAPPPGAVTVRLQLLWTTTNKACLEELTFKSDELTSALRYGAGAAQAEAIRKAQAGFNVAAASAARRAADDSDANEYTVGLVKRSVVPDILSLAVPQAEAWKVWEAERAEARAGLAAALAGIRDAEAAAARMRADAAGEGGAGAAAAAAGAAAGAAAASGAGSDAAASSAAAAGGTEAGKDGGKAQGATSPAKPDGAHGHHSHHAHHHGPRASPPPPEEAEAKAEEERSARLADLLDAVLGGGAVVEVGSALMALECRREAELEAAAAAGDDNAASVLADLVETTQERAAERGSVVGGDSAAASRRGSVASAVSGVPARRGLMTRKERDEQLHAAAIAAAARQRRLRGCVTDEHARDLRDCLSAAKQRVLIWVPSPDSASSHSGYQGGDSRGATDITDAGRAFNDSVLAEAHALFARKERRRRRRIRGIANRVSGALGELIRPDDLAWLEWEHEAVSDDSEMSYDSAGSDVLPHFVDEAGWEQSQQAVANAFAAGADARAGAAAGGGSGGSASGAAAAAGGGGAAAGGGGAAGAAAGGGAAGGSGDASAAGGGAAAATSVEMAIAKLKPGAASMVALPPYAVAWAEERRQLRVVKLGRPTQESTLPNLERSWTRFDTRACRLTTRMPPASPLLPTALRMITGSDPRPSGASASIEVDLCLLKLQDVVPGARVRELLAAMQRAGRTVGRLDSHGHRHAHPLIRLSSPGSIALARPGASPEFIPLPLLAKQVRRHVTRWHKARQRASGIGKDKATPPADGAEPSARSEREQEELAEAARRQAGWLVDVAGAPPASDPRALCWQFDVTHTFSLPPLSQEQLARATVELDVFDESYAVHHDLDDLALPVAPPDEDSVPHSSDDERAAGEAAGAGAGAGAGRAMAASAAGAGGRTRWSQMQRRGSTPRGRVKPSANARRVRRLLDSWRAKRVFARAGAAGLHMGSITLPLSWLLARSTILRENGGRAGHPMWAAFRPAEWMMEASRVLVAESITHNEADLTPAAAIDALENLALPVSGWLSLAAQARVLRGRSAGQTSGSHASEAHQVGLEVHRLSTREALTRELREYKRTGRLAPVLSVAPAVEAGGPGEVEGLAAGRKAGGGVSVPEPTPGPASAAAGGPSAQPESKEADEESKGGKAPKAKKRGFMRGFGAGKLVKGAAGLVNKTTGAVTGAVAGAAGAVTSAGRAVGGVLGRKKTAAPEAESKADDSTPQFGHSGSDSEDDYDAGSASTTTDETGSETDSDEAFENDEVDPVAGALARARRPLRAAADGTGAAASAAPAAATDLAVSKAQFAAVLLAAVHVPRGVAPKLHWCVVTLHKVVDIPAMDSGFLGLAPKTDLLMRVKLGAAEFRSATQTVTGKTLLGAELHMQVRLPFWTPLPSFAHSRSLLTNDGMSAATQAARVLFKNMSTPPEEAELPQQPGLSTAPASAAAGAGKDAKGKKVKPPTVKTAVWSGTDVDPDSGCTLGRLSIGVYDEDSKNDEPIAHSHMAVHDVMALQREQARERSTVAAALSAVNSSATQLLSKADAPKTPATRGRVGFGVRFAAKTRPIRSANPEPPPSKAAEAQAAIVATAEEEAEVKGWADVLPDLPRLFRGGGGAKFLKSIRQAGARPTVVSSPRAQRMRLGFGPAWVPLYGAQPNTGTVAGFKIGGEGDDPRRMPQNADQRLALSYRGALLVSVRVEGPDCDIGAELRRAELEERRSRADDIERKAAASEAAAASAAAASGASKQPDGAEDEAPTPTGPVAVSAAPAAAAADGKPPLHAGGPANIDAKAATSTAMVPSPRAGTAPSKPSGLGNPAAIGASLLTAAGVQLHGSLSPLAAAGAGGASALFRSAEIAGKTSLSLAAAATSLARMDVRGATLNLRRAALTSGLLSYLRSDGLTNKAGRPTAAVWHRSVRPHNVEKETKLLTRYVLVALAISGSDIGHRGAKRAVLSVSMGALQLSTAPADIEAGRVYWAQSMEQSGIVMPRQPSQVPDVMVSVSLDGGPPVAHARIPAAQLIAQQWRSTPVWLHLKPDPSLIRPRITASGGWSGFGGSVCVWLGLGRARQAIPHDVWTHAQRSLGRKPPVQVVAESRAEHRRQADLRAAELMAQGRAVSRIGRVYAGKRVAVVTVTSDDTSGDDMGGRGGGDDEDDGYSSAGSIASGASVRKGKAGSGADDSEEEAAGVVVERPSVLASTGIQEQAGTGSESDTSTTRMSKRAARDAAAQLGSKWEAHSSRRAVVPSDLHWAHQIESALGQLAQYQVRVHVYQGRHLPGLDRSGTSDCFVRARLGEASRCMLKDLDRQPVTAVHPHLNATLLFNIVLPPSPLAPELLLELYDHNTFAPHERIGTVRIPLHEANEVDAAWLVQEARRVSAQFDVGGLLQVELNPNKAMQAPCWRPVVLEPGALFRLGDGDGLLPPASAAAVTIAKASSDVLPAAMKVMQAATGALPDPEGRGAAAHAPSHSDALAALEKADSAGGEGIARSALSPRSSATPFTKSELVSGKTLAQELSAQRQVGATFGTAGLSAPVLAQFRRALARTLRRTEAAFDFDSTLPPHARDARSRPGALMAVNARRAVQQFQSAQASGRRPSFFEVAALALALSQTGMTFDPEDVARLVAPGSQAQGEAGAAASGAGGMQGIIPPSSQLAARQHRPSDNPTRVDWESLDIEKLATAASADIDADRLVGVSEPVRPEVLIGVQLIRRVMNDAQKDGVTVGGRVPIPMAMPEPLRHQVREVAVRIVILHARCIQAPFALGTSPSAPLSVLGAPRMRIQLTDQNPDEENPRFKPSTLMVRPAAAPQEQASLRDALMGFLSGVASALGISRASDSKTPVPGPTLTMAAAAGHQPRAHGNHKTRQGKTAAQLRKALDARAAAAAAAAAGAGGNSDGAAAEQAPAAAAAGGAAQPPRWFTQAEVAADAKARDLLPAMPESDAGLDHIAALYAGRSYFCSSTVLSAALPLTDARKVMSEVAAEESDGSSSVASSVAFGGPARDGQRWAQRSSSRRSTGSRGSRRSKSGKEASDARRARRKSRRDGKAATRPASRFKDKSKRTRAERQAKRFRDAELAKDATIPTVMHKWVDRIAPRLHWTLIDDAHLTTGGGLFGGGQQSGLTVGEASVPLPLDALPFLTAEQFQKQLHDEREGQWAIDGGEWSRGAEEDQHQGPMALRPSSSAAAAAAARSLWTATERRQMAAAQASGQASSQSPSGLGAAGGRAGTPHIAAGKLQLAFRKHKLRKQGRESVQPELKAERSRFLGGKQILSMMRGVKALGSSVLPLSPGIRGPDAVAAAGPAGSGVEGGIGDVASPTAAATTAVAPGSEAGSVEVGGRVGGGALAVSAAEEERLKTTFRGRRASIDAQKAKPVPDRTVARGEGSGGDGDGEAGDAAAGAAAGDADEDPTPAGQKLGLSSMIPFSHLRAKSKAPVLTAAQQEAREMRQLVRRIRNTRHHIRSTAGGLISNLRNGLLRMDASVFELSALEALDVRREDVPRDLPPWMRRRSVLRCALGILLPSGNPVFKDFAVYRSAAARSTGSANPAGYRQSGLIRAHISVTDPDPRWRDLEPLNRGQRMMRDAGKKPTIDMSAGPPAPVRRILDLAGSRQKVTVRVYLTTARFTAESFFRNEEIDTKLYGSEEERIKAIGSALKRVDEGNARRKELQAEAQSAGTAVAGTARRLGDAFQEGALTAKGSIMNKDGQSARDKARARSEVARMRALRRRGLIFKPEDLPDDAPYVDASGMFHKPSKAPLRAEDAVFARVHLRDKSVQGSGHRPVLVRRGTTGRQFGFEVRRAEGGAGGDKDASEADLHECLELDCVLPDTALLVVELFRQRPQVQEPEEDEDPAAGADEAAGVGEGGEGERRPGKAKEMGAEARAATRKAAGMGASVAGQATAAANAAAAAEGLQVDPHGAKPMIEFIGGCIIDLEHRWLHPAWQSMAHGRNPTKLPPMPIETRLLRGLDGSPAGSLQMWCDMLTAERAAANPPLVIAPPPPVAMELRVTVWRVRGMDALGWSKTPEGRKGGYVPFFVRGWLHDPSFDYRAVAALAEASGGHDLVEYPGEQRTSTGVAIPCGEAAELADDIEVKRGVDAKNDFAASACATIGEMGFVPPLFFAKVADALHRRAEDKRNGVKREDKPRRPQPAAEAAAQGGDAAAGAASAASAAGTPAAASGSAARSPGMPPVSAQSAASPAAGGAKASAGGKTDAGGAAAAETPPTAEEQEYLAAEAAAEESAARYLPQSMWPSGGGPRPEDRVLPQATHAAFNWRMSFPVTHQRWGRMPVPGPLMLEMDACGQNTTRSCGATRWRGRGACIIDITRAVKICSQHPQSSNLVVPGVGYLGVSNAQKAMAWVPISLAKHKDEEEAEAAEAAAAEAAAEAAAGDPTRSPDSGDADEALDHAKEALKPHSLQPAVLVSVELVPLAASVAFAKENGGKRPGLGREEPNAEPYLKDPGAILRQIEAVRRKRAGGHCCATM
ncbi:hypothetical protein FNF27_06090 [Cafeteria roenbergensis]|uniref:PH domain-containing protein n=2 Tax=Cafeteria roenbergensis TaxID=33653 RepID=A0A5A8E8R7_CAFRO|nr:hypothetical protein FNF27_06090 [Cafeteria roenbergensis]